ncbi:ATP synthase subunit I [Evansella sp. AB-rgal1]|uniref:ATP synthase subunit I n=1 Tax=Evansella sp. AB-rgal1 TaxID=3242696 RepID=UPI00359E33BA
MMEFHAIAKRYTFVTIGIILVFLILALVLPNRTFYMGVTFGASFSLLNLVNTYIQVKKIGEVLEGEKKPSLLIFGTLTRIIAAVAAVAIALQFPEYLQVEGVIIGLAITYFIILIEPMFHIKKLNQ